MICSYSNSWNPEYRFLWPKRIVKDLERGVSLKEGGQLRREEKEGKITLVITWMQVRLNPNSQVFLEAQRNLAQTGEICRGEGDMK